MLVHHLEILLLNGRQISYKYGLSKEAIKGFNYDCGTNPTVGRLCLPLQLPRLPELSLA